MEREISIGNATDAGRFPMKCDFSRNLSTDLEQTAYASIQLEFTSDLHTRREIL